MHITERDIFMYVWDPIRLDFKIFSYLETNHKKFKNQIELVHQIYIENDAADLIIDKKILKKIYEKMSNFNEMSML